MSWICAIWQGVSSFVLQASVVSATWSGWSVAYCLPPAIMASQNPPVALVIRVTLIGPSDEAAELLASELPPHADTSATQAPSPATAISRDDTGAAPLLDPVARRCAAGVKRSYRCAGRTPTIQETSCSWLASVAAVSPTLRPRRRTMAAVGDRHHVVHAVGDEDDGDAVVSKASDQLEDLGGLAQAERGGGLVQDDQAGGERHRSRDGDGLSLATGHQGDVGVEVRQPHLQPVEQLAGARGSCRAGRASAGRWAASAGRAISRPAKKFAVGLRLSNRARSW